MKKDCEEKMDKPFRPVLRLLEKKTVQDVKQEAIRVLHEIGVFVEHGPAVDLLAGAGAKVGKEGRVHITPSMVDKALETAPSEIVLYDRQGEHPIRLAGDEVHFDPGSMAIKVYDFNEKKVRKPVREDCIRFAQLTEMLPHMDMQSTCVLPNDVPNETAGRFRLYAALKHCTKPVVTGVLNPDCFEKMHEMLACVRGDADALREKPLAIFDCCPSPPLKWSELTCACLVACAQNGVPAELVSMPLTGATAPVTLLGAVVQHAAENLSGVVIHQLAGPGAPIIYGGSPSGFDLRKGTTPMGAIETMMIDSAYAQVGKHLGLPTHAYMGLSDAKTPDWQAGMEGGMGAVLAALTGVNVVSGAGMLDFESCQSLENLLAQNEACGQALRLVRGLSRRDHPIALDVLKEGLAAGHFLSLDHTRKWAREEFCFPGPSIDRVEGPLWEQLDGRPAAERAHDEVKRLLERADTPPFEESLERELLGLAGGT
jgi:trimethylamine--corrinoid protein Co-methyltransferase